MPDTLTQFLQPLALSVRVKTRRRIEMMADHWALALRHRRPCATATAKTPKGSASGE